VGYFLRPAANTDFQRTGLVKMKVSIPAIPALPQFFGRAAARLEGWANLPWPNIPLYVWGFARVIFPPALFHAATPFW